MYDFTHSQRRALERLPSQAARVALERWTEITHEDTHPYWRCRPHAADLQKWSQQLVAAIRHDDVDAAVAAIPAIAGTLLARGSRDWQHNAVKTFLIDPNEKNARLDFLTRLERFASGVGRPDATDTDVTLRWQISRPLPATTKLPKIQAINLGPDEREYRLVPTTEGDSTCLMVETTFRGDHVRTVARAGAGLRAYGSSLLDLVRVTYGDPDLFGSYETRVQGSSHMTYVRPRPIPRVRSRARARQAVENVIRLVQAGSDAQLGARLLGAARWFSTAITRWPENPVFATGLLWMALEAIFGKCIIAHRKCSHRRQNTAVDLYSSHLVASLSAELESYLLRRAARMKTPEQYIPKRGNRAPREWITALPEAILRNEPLLQWHCAELLKFEKTHVLATRETAENDLHAIRKMRNFLAHEGDPSIEDEHADYLAAFATELLFICFEHPESLLLESAA